MTTILSKTYLQENLINYSKHNLIFFPLIPKDKKPKCKWGSITASVPIQNGDNVAIVTGLKNNITVVDIDAKDGGLKIWEELVDEYGEIDTPIVQTGSGGYHYYFRYNDNFGTRVKLQQIGIDTRNNGGYAVAPPSIHETGYMYIWIKDLNTPLADVPQWLLDFLTRPSQQKKTKTGTKITGNFIVSDAFISKVIQHVEKQDDGDLIHYNVRGIKDNIILFNRVTNGIHTCRLCGGEHEADNKLYITCFELRDVAYLHCRNTDKKQIIYKGKSNLKLNEYINIIKPNQETYTMKEIQTNPLINPYELTDKVLLIKSPCGTGKTKQLIQYLKQFQKILVISFRISLTNELTNKMSELGMKSYLDKNVKRNSDSNYHEKGDFTEERLIIQYESLHKVDDDMEYDILVIDEMESVMAQMYSKTNVKHFNANLLTMNSLIQNTKHVICLDAYMSQRTLNYLKCLDQEVHVIYNNYQAEKDSTYYITKSIDTIYIKIVEELRNNKRVVICSSCSIKDIKGLYESLENEFPNKKGKLYTSESPKEMKDDLKNVEKAWKGVDYLIYSPTIMAGVSFESENFDVLFGLASNNSCGVKAFIQMLKRVRSIKEKKYYIGIQDIQTKYLETYRERIRDDVQRNLKSIMDEIHLSSYKNLLEDDKLKLNLYIDNAWERNRDEMDFLPRFVSYLKEYGAKMKVIDKNEVPKNPEVVQDIKDRIKKVTHENFKDIAETKDIDEEECAILQWNAEDLTEQEQYRLTKYFLRIHYNYWGELDEEKVKFMVLYSNKEVISNLNKHPTLEDLQSSEICAINNAQNPYHIISNSLYLKFSVFHEIFELFDYQFDFETFQEENSEEFTNEEIKKRMQTYLTKEKQSELRKLYQYKYKINIEDLKSINKLIDYIFEIFNFKMAFIRKKDTNGRIYRIAFYDTYYIDGANGEVTLQF